MTDGPASGTTRRELLKMSPALLLGAVAVPAWRERLLSAGIDFSDRASGALFRGAHPAPTLADAALIPFEQFPYNGFGPPPIDFEQWTLAVGGAVARPGPYACRPYATCRSRCRTRATSASRGGTRWVASAAHGSLTFSRSWGRTRRRRFWW